MPEDRLNESEFGSSTGDSRENDPSLPGYTESDQLFRSHFQHAIRQEHRAYEDVRPAYQLGYAAAGDPRFAGREFDQAEKDLEGEWLNIRFAGNAWQSVRDYAREGFLQGRRIGFINGHMMVGETGTHQRPSFSDPVAENIDPTDPDSPENRRLSS